MRFKDEKELPKSGGQSFLRLKDGEVATGVFIGEPYEFSVVWENKKPNIVPDGTPNSKFRFRINFVTKDESGYVAKIFEQGTDIYRRLISLNQDFQGVENVVVKISRVGSGMNDTEYRVDPVMDPKNPRQLMPVPPGALALKPLDLRDSNKKTFIKASSQIDPGAHDFGPPPPEMDDDEIPF